MTDRDKWDEFKNFRGEPKRIPIRDAPFCKKCGVMLSTYDKLPCRFCGHDELEWKTVY